MLSHSRKSLSSETGQERLLRSPLYPKRAACCPIRSEVIDQMATLPQYGSQAGKQPREAVPPVAAGVQEALRIQPRMKLGRTGKGARAREPGPGSWTPCAILRENGSNRTLRSVWLRN